jgi:hypothetical protein
MNINIQLENSIEKKKIIVLIVVLKLHLEQKDVQNVIH